ncbi:hypothetical protein C8R45DRAFT_934356 [Mycena sanguinolenta]|nr:hypothetical protein C8R45DRAFT_934356 [Mycena sanguinolenta]
MWIADTDSNSSILTGSRMEDTHRTVQTVFALSVPCPGKRSRAGTRSRALEDCRDEQDEHDDIDTLQVAFRLQAASFLETPTSTVAVVDVDEGVALDEHAVLPRDRPQLRRHAHVSTLALEKSGGAAGEDRHLEGTVHAADADIVLAYERTGSDVAEGPSPRVARLRMLQDAGVVKAKAANRNGGGGGGVGGCRGPLLQHASQTSMSPPRTLDPLCVLERQLQQRRAWRHWRTAKAQPWSKEWKNGRWRSRWETRKQMIKGRKTGMNAQSTQDIFERGLRKLVDVRRVLAFVLVLGVKKRSADLQSSAFSANNHEQRQAFSNDTPSRQRVFALVRILGLWGTLESSTERRQRRLPGYSVGLKSETDRKRQRKTGVGSCWADYVPALCFDLPHRGLHRGLVRAACARKKPVLALLLQDPVFQFSESALIW